MFLGRGTPFDEQRLRRAVGTGPTTAPNINGDVVKGIRCLRSVWEAAYVNVLFTATALLNFGA